MKYTCKKCGAAGDESAFYIYNGKCESVCKECRRAASRAVQAAKPKLNLKRYKFKEESDMTLEALNDLLEYKPENGEFLWKRNAGGTAVIGSIAGYIAPSGYGCICLGGRDFRTHRLVWFAENGKFPDKGLVIDHINRNPLDNRIHNLRPVPEKINAHNIVKAKKNNKLGLLGVKRNHKRFQANIYDPEGKPFYIGTFDTPQQAQDAYWEKKREFYPTAVLLEAA